MVSYGPYGDQQIQEPGQCGQALTFKDSNMTHTITTKPVDSDKPLVETSWQARPPEPIGGVDFGYHEPALPIRFTPPAGPIDTSLQAYLTSELVHLFKGDLYPWMWLLSPDLGSQSSSFSRPDLIPILQHALDCLQAVRDELLQGPRRTAWDPGAGAFRVIVPSATEEGRARADGRLKKGH